MVMVMVMVMVDGTTKGVSRKETYPIGGALWGDRNKSNSPTTRCPPRHGLVFHAPPGVGHTE